MGDEQMALWRSPARSSADGACLIRVHRYQEAERVLSLMLEREQGNAGVGV